LIEPAIAEFGHELSHLRSWARLRNDRGLFPEKGMYDWIESQILYLLIRATKPRVVVEISPGSGYSSGFLLLALNANGLGELHSFDLRSDLEGRAQAAFARAAIDATRRSFHGGDARASAPAVLAEAGPVDLLFLDSEHSGAFARWYVETLFPHVRAGGLIHVHDVLPNGDQPHHAGDHGEGVVIADFVRQQADRVDHLYVSTLVGDEFAFGLSRYPFADRSIGCDGVEQNPSLWIWLSPASQRVMSPAGSGRRSTGPAP
jgi:predicted O-methyltransferase YrrM